MALAIHAEPVFGNRLEVHQIVLVSLYGSRSGKAEHKQAARRPAPSAVADAAAAFCALLSLMITWREDRAHHQRNLLDSMSQVPVSVERYSQVPRAMGTGLVASRNSLSIFITVDITL